MIKANPSNSWWWKKLLNLNPIFKSVITYSIRDGKSICLWHDNWHPLGPLVDTFGPNIDHLLGIPLESKLSEVIHDQCYRWPSARSSAMLEVPSSLPPIHSGHDILRWNPSRFGFYHTGAT